MIKILFRAIGNTFSTLYGKCIWFCFLMLCCTLSVSAVPSVTLIGDSTVASSGLTLASDATYGCQINGLSFQQDIITSYNGYQYVAYYNGDRRVCLARRILDSDIWQTIIFTDYLFSGDDAHDTISMGICPNDGTIHLAFDHHGDDLNYRVSLPDVATDPSSFVWSSSLFGPILDTLESSVVKSVTYPAFIRTPEGDLQLIYRYGTSGDGIWNIYDYSGQDHTWSNNRTFLIATGNYTDSLGSSTTRCAYPNYYCYGPDGVLQVSWCWRESASGANHDICYAFSKDRGYNWYGKSFTNISFGVKNNDGTRKINLLTLSRGVSKDDIVCNTQDKFISVETDEVVVKKLDRAYGMMNTQAHAIDGQGRPHIVMWHCTDESLTAVGSTPGATRWGPSTARFYHHYWQGEDGLWHNTQIPGYAGSRPKLFMRSNGDAILLFQACRTVESLGADIYFTNGDLKIFAATAANQWSDWQQVYELKNGSGYFMNEMLGDVHLFSQSNTELLSVFVQEQPGYSRQPTTIRTLDFKIQ